MNRYVTAGLLLGALAAWADDGELRAKLTGSWKIDSGDAKTASGWVLQPIADGMHISGSNGEKVAVEFDCQMAKECQIKDAGHHAKVMMYFNGAKLIETETIGSRVVKRRFTVTGNGDTMEVETIPVEPEGKPETAVFKRVLTAAAKQ
jgi:hypothetical protein